MSSKVDYTRLNTEVLMDLEYYSDFVSLPFEEKYFKNKSEFNYLDNLYEEVQGVKPSVLPCVVRARQALFQDIIPLRGFLSEGQLIIMWGGYANKEHWLTIPAPSYTVAVKKDSTFAVFELIDVELVEQKETASLVKAKKLSALDEGTYKILEGKPRTTSYGPTYIVVIENEGEFWANAQLKRLVDMLGNVSVLKGMTLNVLSKTTTTQGHLSVKIGLQK